MRKLILVAALVCLMCSVGIANAGILDMVGVGTEVNVGFNRELALSELGQDIEMDMETYLITLPVQLADWLVITPMIGVAHNSFSADTSFATIEADTDAGIAAGIRVEAKLYEVKVDNALLNGLTVTGFGSYLFSNTEIDTVSIGVLEINNPLRNDVTLHDMELGAKLSKKIGVVTPYIGIAYTNIFGQAKINASVINLEDDIVDRNDNGSVGMRLGLGAEPISGLTLSVDGKLFDQTAIGGKVSYKF